MRVVPANYRWIALLFALLCQCGANVIYQAMAPLAPLFQADLGLTKAEVGLVSAFSSIGVWSIALTGGLLTDRFGVRRVMSLCLVAAGSVLLSMVWAGSLVYVLGVMLLTGLARGPVFPSSTKAVAEWFPPRERATAMGLKQLGLPAAGIAAAILLPALGLAMGWRTAAAVPGLLVVLIGLSVALFYRDAPVPVLGRASRASIGQAVVDLFGNRMLRTLSVVGFCYLFAQLSLVTYFALYFKDVALLLAIPDYGARIVAAGGFLAVCHLGGAFARVFWGFLSDRIFPGRRALVLVLIGGLSGLMLLLLGIAGSGSPLWWLTILAFGCGASALGWNGVYGALITDIVGSKYAATGVGLSMTVTDIATIASPPLFGLVVDQSGGYSAAWVLFSIFSGLGALAAWFLRRQERSGQLMCAAPS